MNYKIRAFGIASDILGAKEVTLSVDGNTVADLRAFLSSNYPELNELRSLFIAVNHEYAGDQITLQEIDEIAIIPPVSGG